MIILYLCPVLFVIIGWILVFYACIGKDMECCQRVVSRLKEFAPKCEIRIRRQAECNVYQDDRSRTKRFHSNTHLVKFLSNTDMYPENTKTTTADQPPKRAAPTFDNEESDDGYDYPRFEHPRKAEEQVILVTADIWKGPESNTIDEVYETVEEYDIVKPSALSGAVQKETGQMGFKNKAERFAPASPDGYEDVSQYNGKESLTISLSMNAAYAQY